MAKGLGDKPYCAHGIHMSLADIAVGCAWVTWTSASRSTGARRINWRLHEKLMQRIPTWPVCLRAWAYVAALRRSQRIKLPTSGSFSYSSSAASQ
jgi:hypothetical protein